MTNIHPSAVIYPGVVIEPGAHIGPFCVIGAPPEVKGFTGQGRGVLISSGTRLEKCVVIDSGHERPTVIGKDCMLMSGVHVGHDVLIQDRVIISPNASIGGHVTIRQGAYIGMNAVIHQHQTIGDYCMIGMGAVITRKVLVLPCSKWVGNPAREIGENTIGMDRAGITQEDKNKLIQFFL